MVVVVVLETVKNIISISISVSSISSDRCSTFRRQHIHLGDGKWQQLYRRNGT